MAALVPVCDVLVVLETLWHITSQTQLALPFFLGCGFISYMHTAHDNKKLTMLKINRVVKIFLNKRRRERRDVWSVDYTGLLPTLLLGFLHQINCNELSELSKITLEAMLLY